MTISQEKNNKMFDMLVEGHIDLFNEEREKGALPDFSSKNFRGIDLRRCQLDGVSLNGAYLGNTDLRGLDLRNCDLEGASIKAARISGVFFPISLPADEITMSNQLGTRLRVRK
jgi:hypothetical protein